MFHDWYHGFVINFAIQEMMLRLYIFFVVTNPIQKFFFGEKIYTVSRVEHDSRATSRCIEWEDGLNGDVHSRDIKRLKHYLKYWTYLMFWVLSEILATWSLVRVKKSYLYIMIQFIKRFFEFDSLLGEVPNYYQINQNLETLADLHDFSCLQYLFTILISKFYLVFSRKL